jgi:hypothetical protein
MNRRRLLQGLALSLWSGPAAAAQRLPGRLRLGQRHGLDGASTGSAGQPTLSAGEIESLLALGEVVAQGRVLLPAERAHLADEIGESTRVMPDRLSRYRMAAGFLDRLAPVSFARLPFYERAELVGRHLDGRDVPDDGLLPFAAEAREVRAKVVPDLIDAYWRSPAGWAAVGYVTFPGRCGDLARYTRPDP